MREYILALLDRRPPLGERITTQNSRNITLEILIWDTACFILYANDKPKYKEYILLLIKNPLSSLARSAPARGSPVSDFSRI
jgi:hypothetical protein